MKLLKKKTDSNPNNVSMSISALQHLQPEEQKSNPFEPGLLVKEIQDKQKEALKQ